MRAIRTNLWESSALDQVSLCGDKLFLVHLADGKRPRSFHDRYVPGEGQVPLVDFVKGANALQYTGCFVVELFSDGVADHLDDGANPHAISAMMRPVADALSGKAPW